MASKGTVLITAVAVAAPAIAMLREAGYRVVQTSSYPAEAEILAAIERDPPVAILHRQGFISGAVMDAAAPGLRVVARHGAGVDGIDIAAAQARGLTVTRAAGANARSVAEHTWAILLAALKDLPAITKGMREGLWEKTSRQTRDVAGLTIGIVGYGAIGSKVARYAEAFGMRVVAYDPFLPGEGLPGPGERIATLPELLRQAEVLSLHCPLDQSTRHMIGAPELALLPKGALVVNAARGGVLQEAALLVTLESGHLAGAAIDVFETEPLPADSRLRNHPLVLATPHIAANTPRGAEAMAIGAADSIMAVLEGSEPALTGAVVVDGRDLDRTALQRLA